MAALLPPFQHTVYFNEINKKFHCGLPTKNNRMPDSFIQIPFCRTEPVPQEKRKCPGFWEKLEKLLRAVCTKLEISACPCISLRRLVRILNSSGRFVKCVKTRVAAVSRRIARFLPALLQKHHFGKSYISSISCFNWK